MLPFRLLDLKFSNCFGALILQTIFTFDLFRFISLLFSYSSLNNF